MKGHFALPYLALLDRKHFPCCHNILLLLGILFRKKCLAIFPTDIIFHFLPGAVLFWVAYDDNHVEFSLHQLFSTRWHVVTAEVLVMNCHHCTKRLQLIFSERSFYDNVERETSCMLRPSRTGGNACLTCFSVKKKIENIHEEAKYVTMVRWNGMKVAVIPGLT